MSSYRVSWEIDSEAGSPREAALEAREAQVRPNTQAVVFHVTGVDGTCTRVDLLEDPEEDSPV